jgi:hypothetical protein
LGKECGPAISRLKSLVPIHALDSEGLEDLYGNVYVTQNGERLAV